MFLLTGIFHLVTCLILWVWSWQLMSDGSASPKALAEQRRVLFTVTFSGLLHSGFVVPIAVDLAPGLIHAANWKGVAFATIPSFATILPLLPLIGLHPRIRAKHKLMTLLSAGGALFTLASLVALMWVLIQII